jgi:hypothetical protein
MVKFAFFMLLFSNALFASPIFFKCDEKGQLSEFLTGEDVLKGLQKMQVLLKGNNKKLFEELCTGNIECEKTLSQVLTLTNISTETAKKKRDDLLIKLKTEMNAVPIAKVSAEAQELEKSIREAAAGAAACRQSLVSLNPDDWVKGDCVSFYYPVKNEYTFASGYKIKTGQAESQGCSTPDELKVAIRKALIMGVDPVMFLSIGLMEGGFDGWKYLSLDPIGTKRAMGCPEKKSNVTRKDEKKLVSFGNFHSISAALVKDKNFNDRAQNFLKDSKEKVGPGKQYYCSSVTEASVSFKDKPGPNDCCLELDFKTDNVEKVSEALVQHYMYKLRSERPYGSSDPAFRLQSFNGFSKLMGGGEAVPAFRGGVDYTKTPAYGYQAMDFILNNLQSNPWLLREIEVQKKTLSLSNFPPSILCEGNPKGSYHVDSKHYLNLHRQSARMNSIMNKPFTSMTEREKRVMTKEIEYMIEKGLFPEKINGKTVPKPKPQQSLANLTFELPKQSIETSEGIKDEIQMATFDGSTKKKLNGFLPANLNEGFTLEVQGLIYEVLPLEGSLLKLQPQISSVMHPASMIAATFPMNYEFEDGSSVKVKGNGIQECFDNKKVSSNCIDLVVTNANVGYKMTSPGSGYHLKIKKSDSPSSEAIRISTADGNKWVQIKTLIEKPNLELKATPVDEPKVKVSMAELVSYYFKNLHHTRNTIEKASSFGPWKDLTDDEIKLIGESPKPTKTEILGGTTAVKESVEE